MFLPRKSGPDECHFSEVRFEPALGGSGRERCALAKGKGEGMGRLKNTSGTLRELPSFIPRRTKKNVQTARILSFRSTMCDPRLYLFDCNGMTLVDTPIETRGVESLAI